MFGNMSFDNFKNYAQSMWDNSKFPGLDTNDKVVQACAITGAVALIGAGAYLAYRKICKKPAPQEPVESAADRLFRLETERLKEFLASKHITECCLPPYIDQRSSSLEPVLDPATRETVEVEATKMAEAVKDNCEVPPCLAFYGPAGTGKTTLMATLPIKIGYATIHIDPALLQKYMQLGKAEELLMDIKHESEQYAAKTGRPVMLVLEDCEQLFAKRKSEEEKKAEQRPRARWEENQLSAAQLYKQHQDAFVNALLRELGKEQGRRFCVGVTLNESRKWLVDDALATRFKYIHIPLPSMQHRKKILELHIPRYFNNDLTKMRFFDMGRLEQMALATEGFTGRNLIRVLQDIRSQMQLAEGDLNQGMVESAINKVAQSIEMPAKPAKTENATTPGAIAAQAVATAVENVVDFTAVICSRAISNIKVYWMQFTKAPAASTESNTQESDIENNETAPAA